MQHTYSSIWGNADRQRFYSAMLTGGGTPGQAARWGLPLDAGGYAVLLIRLFRTELFLEPFCGALYRMSTALEHVLEEEEGSGAVAFRRRLEGYAVILSAPAGEEALARAYAMADRLCGLLKNEDGVQYYIALGKHVESVTDMPRAYQTAACAMACRFLLPPNRLIACDTLSETLLQLHDRFADAGRCEREITLRFLRGGAREEAAYVAELLIESVGNANMQSVLLRQYLAMHVRLCAAAYLEKLGIDKLCLIGRCEEKLTVARQLSTVAGTMKYLRTVLEETVRLRDEQLQKRIPVLLERARRCIANTGLLEEAAHAVDLDLSQLMDLFAKEKEVGLAQP